MNGLTGHLWGGVAALLLLLASCAKDETTTPFSESERLALQAWMKINRPDLLENCQSDGDYYVEILDPGEADSPAVRDTIYWVQFEFSGRDLQGNVCLTRDETEARQQGTFTKYTHYVPFYKYCGEINTSLIEGIHLSMRNVLTLGEEYAAANGLDTEFEVRMGTEYRLYLPSTIVSSTGVAGDGGYEGQYSLSSGRPMIATMKVVGMIKNPLEYEGGLVDDFAERNGTLKPLSDGDEETKARVRRSLTRGAEEEQYNDGYAWRNAVDTIPQVYVNHGWFPSTQPDSLFTYTAPVSSVADLDAKINEALIERFGTGTLDGDSVKLDGTANIWFIGRFLDGFIFDTNIDEVKEIVYGETVSTGSALEYTPEDGGLIEAFYYSVPQLRFGQWATLITTSSYAYGATGQSGSTSSSTSSSYDYSAYYNMLNYYNYYNSYYGSSYYGSYYNNYYNYYYNGYYNNYYSSSSSTTTTTTTVTTEIQSYTPLIFQFYIEAEEE